VKLAQSDDASLNQPIAPGPTQIVARLTRQQGATLVEQIAMILLK
jgi:hypothetical protein